MGHHVPTGYGGLQSLAAAAVSTGSRSMAGGCRVDNLSIYRGDPSSVLPATSCPTTLPSRQIPNNTDPPRPLLGSVGATPTSSLS